MKTSLLDVNLLVALLWPAHAHHRAALGWFGRKGRRGWATCPFTEAAFIRLTSNPAFSRDAVAPRQAAEVLARNIEGPGHVFWPADVSPCEVLRSPELRLAGHQQVTDAYLLALARRNGGRLVTLDRSMRLLLTDGDATELVETVVV